MEQPDTRKHGGARCNSQFFTKTRQNIMGKSVSQGGIATGEERWLWPSSLFVFGSDLLHRWEQIPRNPNRIAQFRLKMAWPGHSGSSSRCPFSSPQLGFNHAGNPFGDWWRPGVSHGVSVAQKRTVRRRVLCKGALEGSAGSNQCNARTPGSTESDRTQHHYGVGA